MSHSFDKLKNDIFIALIIGPAQAAEMTLWVVFRCTAWLAVDPSASLPNSASFAIVCFVIVFLELFGPQFWFSAMVSFEVVKLSAQGLCYFRKIQHERETEPLFLYLIDGANR